MDTRRTKLLAILVIVVLCGTIMGRVKYNIGFGEPRRGTGRPYDPVEEERKQEERAENLQKVLAIHEARHERVLARQAERKQKRLKKADNEEAIRALEGRVGELEERVGALERMLRVEDANGAEGL